MRIAHVITRMIVGGAQENTLLNCQDLIRDYGDEVLLITGPALGPEGDLLQQGRGGEVPLAMVDSLRRAISPARDWKAYREIKRVLREFKPDVVHTHSAKAGILGRLAAWSLQVPAIVHTIHGAPFGAYEPWPKRTFYQACERYAAARCHHLISVADAMTDLMVAAAIAPRNKFTTIYSGMDVEPFLHADETREQVRRELGFEPQHVVVGKIARLFHLKGHEDVIAAAGFLRKNHPNLRYLFVGDGILREQLQKRIDRAGMHDLFRFTGLVPPARIPALIGAMDILVHTSRREGLSRALPQALIAGKPVVSYDVDGAREVCIDNETGFLVRSCYFDGLWEPLEDLSQDAALRQRLGAEGRRRFTDQFRHETMTRRIRELYGRLLNRP
ncbi:MAG TPA: glycosyltransferase family 4 protein [Pirellulaceae bacterium]|nr:glycosyltransferase family 4 protein [Pirellulaceae bacterium]